MRRYSQRPEALNSLDLELWAVASCLMWVPGDTLKTLCSAISLALSTLLLEARSVSEPRVYYFGEAD